MHLQARQLFLEYGKSLPNAVTGDAPANGEKPLEKTVQIWHGKGLVVSCPTGRGAGIKIWYANQPPCAGHCGKAKTASPLLHRWRTPWAASTRALAPVWNLLARSPLVASPRHEAGSSAALRHRRPGPIGYLKAGASAPVRVSPRHKGLYGAYGSKKTADCPALFA